MGFPARGVAQTARSRGRETNASTPVIGEIQSNGGAVRDGSQKFGGSPGPWSESGPWNGRWGENPRARLEMTSRNSRHFWDDVAYALSRASFSSRPVETMA